MTTLLNFGGGLRSEIPPLYHSGWLVESIDINPSVKPTYIADLTRLRDNDLWPFWMDRYDSIYCSHVLEHLQPSETMGALLSMQLMLKKGGIAFIRLPSIELAMEELLKHNYALDDELEAFKSIVKEGKPKVTYRMVIDGMEDPHMRHYQHFTFDSLNARMKASGFTFIDGGYHPGIYEIMGFWGKGDTVNPRIIEMLDFLK